MKSCKGCKHLLGRMCCALDEWTRETDSLTGTVQWRYTGGVELNRRPFAREMRVSSCGVDRKLYKPTLISKLWAKLFPNSEPLNYAELCTWICIWGCISFMIWFSHIKVIQ